MAAGTSSAGVSAATSNAAADQNVAVLQALVPGAAESSRAAAAAPAAQTQPAGPATDSHKGPSAAARVEGSPQAAASLHTARLATAGAAQQGTAVKWEAAAAVLGPVAASSGGSALQSANQARPVAALQSQAVTGAAAPATCMAPVSSGLALSPASPAVLVPPRGVQLSLEGAAPGVAAEALETALQRADATVSGELAPKIMEELVAAAQAVPESVLAARAEQVGHGMRSYFLSRCNLLLHLLVSAALLRHAFASELQSSAGWQPAVVAFQHCICTGGSLHA